MRIERIICDVHTLGPGSRIAIWTNGCLRNCPNCESKRLQRIDESTNVDVDSCFSQFDYSLYDGVTISGGEPFLDPKELLKLLRLLKSKGVKDILVYTGFTLEEINQNKEMKECTNYIDVLVDGPYVDELNDETSNIKGSSNQRVIYFNEKLKEKYSLYIKGYREVEEFKILSQVIMVGIPTREYITSFMKEGQK